MAHVSSFYVKQKITVMVNQYRVIERLPDGTEGRLLAFAQQKRMSFKEKVFFYADEAKTQEREETDHFVHWGPPAAPRHFSNSPRDD